MSHVKLLGVITRRGWYALAAAACVSATWLPLLIGGALDLSPFLFWGVLSGGCPVARRTS
jgi:hypothetical protein